MKSNGRKLKLVVFQFHAINYLLNSCNLKSNLSHLMSDSIDVDYFIYTDIFFAENMCNVVAKEYKEEAQCAQNGERMLVFVICGRSF